MTTTTYAAIDLATDDEFCRQGLEAAIIDLLETLHMEELFTGQAEEIADEMRTLQAVLDDLDANAPGWRWLQRISTMEEPPENGTTYHLAGADWDIG